MCVAARAFATLTSTTHVESTHSNSEVTTSDEELATSSDKELATSSEEEVTTSSDEEVTAMTSDNPVSHVAAMTTAPSSNNKTKPVTLGVEDEAAISSLFAANTRLMELSEQSGQSSPSTK